jgi:hypothetical protein
MDLFIDEISLVDSPANEGATVVIFKSDRGAEEVAKGEALLKRLSAMAPAELQEVFKASPEVYWQYRQASRRGRVAARSEQVSITKGPVYERVMAAAQELIRADPTLTLEAALGRIFSSHPGTYAAYRLEVATGSSRPLPTDGGNEAA